MSLNNHPGMENMGYDERDQDLQNQVRTTIKLNFLSYFKLQFILSFFSTDAEFESISI